MERRQIPERTDWQAIARDNGFLFHHVNGEKYWDESACWTLGLRELETCIEDPSAELYAMCLALVDEACASQELMERLALPEAAWDVIAQSWRSGAPSLYGRFDFAYDGSGPAKLLEFNADTPTSIYETAYFQWLWLEHAIERGVLPAGSDQFNRLHEALVARMGAILTPGSLLHLSSDAGHVEDRSTVLYLEDIAQQASLEPRFIAIDRIGLDAGGQFVDDTGTQIGALFKLYPWEDILVSEYAGKLDATRTVFLEPAWKAILSNKAMLPLLWRKYAGHPNLLPAAFAGTMAGDEIAAKPHARKPFFSREGADIELDDGTVRHRGPAQGYGAEGHIVQAYAPLATDGTNHAVIGSWIVGDEAVAMSVREDTSPITRDLARFVPHAIVGD
jgi:glutathionylspermidine synthase